MVKSSMAGAILELVLIVPLFYFLGILAIIPVIILNYAAFYLSFHYSEHKIDSDRVCKYTKKEFLTYSRPILRLGVILMASMIATIPFSFMLNLFTNRFGPIEEVGLCQPAAPTITQGMLIINVILASDFFPCVSIIHADCIQMQHTIKQQADIILLIIALTSILMISLALFIAWLLLSPEFTPVINLIRLMGMTLIFKAMWILMSYIILVKGDKRSYFSFDASLGNGINLLISIIGFYFGGLNRLALAYLIGSVFMVGPLWGVTRNRYKIALAVYDLIRMAILLLLVIVAYLVATYVQGVLEYGMLTLICILIGSYSLIQLNRKINIIEIIRSRLLR